MAQGHEDGSKSPSETSRRNGARVATDGPQDVGLAGRYATAVFELAQEEKAVEILEKDFVALKAALASSSDLKRLVRSPVFTREEQGKAIGAVLTRMGVSQLCKNFVLLLAAKRRLFVLADIIRAFEGKLAQMRGEIRATVTSAHKLGDDQMAELKSILKAKLGREPRIETKLDPSLLGGLVVKVGSRMIDSSLRTKLNGIRAAMRGN
jgi:F-type H+-transporting ATPase subunit delta